MSWWSEFANQIEHDVPLGRQTWFRLGGNVRMVFKPVDEKTLSAFMQRAKDENVVVKVLGAGANVLISDDGFDGAVVRLDGDNFRRVNQVGSSFEVGAGVDLMPLSKECSQRGYAGLECMAGIPATIGGAIRMNAGGKFGDISQVVREIRVLRSDGKVNILSHEKIGFGYRHTNLAEQIVLFAKLELQQGDPEQVYARYGEIFDYKMSSQPMADNSAGCIFKNPTDQSAGALIDQAGLKGVSVGNASVSQHHANFIVAGKDAKAADVMQLIDLVHDRVLDQLGTDLKLEIDVWKPCKKLTTSIK